MRSWGRVLENRPAAADTCWLEIDCPGVADHAAPGQFVMLGTGLGDVAAPFLPRPFSIGARGPGRRLGFLIRVFGEGTRRLAELGPGDDLLVLGPLGRPFRLPQIPIRVDIERQPRSWSPTIRGITSCRCTPRLSKRFHEMTGHRHTPCSRN